MRIKVQDEIMFLFPNINGCSSNPSDNEQQSGAFNQRYATKTIGYIIAEVFLVAL